MRATGERPPLARFFGVRAGSDLLVRSIEDKSPAANAGLDAADIIVTANGMPLETTADWLQTLRINAGHAVALTVRNRKVLTPAITIYTRITQSELVIPSRYKSYANPPIAIRCRPLDREDPVPLQATGNPLQRHRHAGANKKQAPVLKNRRLPAYSVQDVHFTLSVNVFFCSELSQPAA